MTRLAVSSIAVSFVLTSLNRVMTLDGMMNALVATPGRIGEYPNDIIRRVVKAWLGAYDMTQEEFAEALGMNPRTFARRLADNGPGKNFNPLEISKIAKFMSACLGEPISVSDIFMGRVDVSRAWRVDSATGAVTGEYEPTVTLPKILPQIRAINLRPDNTAPIRGHLSVVTP